MTLLVLGNDYLLQKIATYLGEEFDEGLLLCCRTVYVTGYSILRYIHISAQILILKQNKVIVFKSSKDKILSSRTYGHMDGEMDIHQIGRYKIEILIVDKNATLDNSSGLNMNAISIILVTRLAQVTVWPTKLTAVLLSQSDDILKFCWTDA